MYTDEFTLGTLPSSLSHVNLTWHFTQHEYLIFTLLFYFCIWRWQDPMLSGLDGSCQIDDDRKILDRVNLIAQNLFCQIIPIWLDWIIFLNWITTIKQARIIEPKLTPRRPSNFELTCTLSAFFPDRTHTKYGPVRPRTQYNLERPSHISDPWAVGTAVWSVPVYL